MHAYITTFMKWSAGILRGHSDSCPHEISTLCTARPPPLRQPSNPDYPHLTHAVTMAVTIDQLHSMVLEPYRWLAPKIPAQRAASMPELSYFNGTNFAGTVLWMWHTCRTGIAVSIRGGHLVLFVPFCNTSYTNTWSDAARNCMPGTGLPADRWWANGWTLCGDAVSEQQWGDQGVCAIQNMLCTACKYGIISDCDFIINKRDSACVRLDGCDPLNPIDSYQTPHYERPSLVPVLSLYTGDQFADLAMPLPCDWHRLTRGTFHAQHPLDVYTPPRAVDWSSKRDTAVFRGGITGAGGHAGTNQRLALLYHHNGYNIDARGTSMNQRFRYCPIDKQVVRPVASDTLDIGRHHYIPLQKQQETYRYAISVDGHSGADRIGALMSGDQVLFKVASPHHALCPDTWVSQRIHRWQHYLPVQADMSDLTDTLAWARKNPEACHAMRHHCMEWSAREYDRIMQWWIDVTSAMSALPS